MPRGDKSSYTPKQKRQASDIEKSYERKGVSKTESERRAWATVNKITGGGLKKPAVKKTATKKTAAKKTDTKKPAAKKTAASKRVPAKKLARKPQAVKARALKPAPAKKTKRRLSPMAKKDLAAKHLWALVEKKKRQAALPPPWQNIGHHDHSAGESTTAETTTPNAAPEKFHIGGHLDRGG